MITGSTSSISVTVIVTERSLVLLELSVAVTVKLYSLFSPSSPGDSKSGAELNDRSPVFEILKRPLSVPDKDQVTVSFALYVDTAVWFS